MRREASRSKSFSRRAVIFGGGQLALFGVLAGRLYYLQVIDADQYKMLKAGYKSSYAFRDKIDTDGFDHPMKTYDLVEELIRRKYSNENITAILGGNFRRLLGATWA